MGCLLLLGATAGNGQRNSPSAAESIRAGEASVVESSGEHAPSAATNGQAMGLLLFVFVLAIFLGVELISKVPSQLHTPLMSGSNAISGITIVGALLAANLADGPMAFILGMLALVLATINVVGGYLVTDRMLAMFKKKGGERE